jgi:uncharacterized FAD-dependent dehydrogenase
MIQITQLKLPVEHTEKDLEERIAAALRIRPSELKSWRIIRRAVDARKKEELRYVYTIQAETTREKQILAKSRHNNVMSIDPVRYRFPEPGNAVLSHRPVIVGSGPAGLFCGYALALHGYRPLILERGDEASVRRERVEQFWKNGVLDPDSNVQFGEGGAGTFSDGKLNTGVKDKNGRNEEVLRIFTEAGAPEEILYDARPHLGTDLLVRIVENLRRRIEEAGGTVRFRTKAEDVLLKDGRVRGIRLDSGETIDTDVLVLAVGHSARDTFSMLWDRGLLMQPKSFAVGVRVEHLQRMITDCQYGPDAPAALGAASYRLACTLENGRGVYSFCMCPGGYVVNASSEPGHLAVNGMSYHARDSHNANSAIVVSVTPEDYAGCAGAGVPAALAGIAFQRELERKAWEFAEGLIPVQRFEDFCLDREGGPGALSPCMKGGFRYANVRRIFSEELAGSLEQGIREFDRKIPGFASPDVLLSGVESRTSSPVRICRDRNLESSTAGIYPCGEGAGYAGGITSAAMDGLRVAEAIAGKYMNIL